MKRQRYSRQQDRPENVAQPLRTSLLNDLPSDHSEVHSQAPSSGDNTAHAQEGAAEQVVLAVENSHATTALLLPKSPKKPTGPAAASSPQGSCPVAQQRSPDRASAEPRTQQSPAAASTCGATSSSKDPIPPALPPVDVDYLQDLIEHELGPPKFSVPKSEAASAHDAQLRALLDKEFGPPKFALQKQPSITDTQAAAVCHATGSAEEEGQPNVLAERPSLQLEAVAGPALGKVWHATEEQAELVIGRLPSCSVSIFDQEVSGRHAAITYDDADGCWKVADLGSLNGSVLNGVVISGSDRHAGQRHVLSDQDVLELGGITRVKVSCGAAAAPPSKRHAPAHTWGPGAKPGSRVQAYTTTKLPPLQHSEDLPCLGLRVAVHQRLGIDHLRTSKPIEDVVLMQCPFEPFGAAAGLFCVFDGHQGSQAAVKAKALVPDMLASKLKGDGNGSLVLGRPAEKQRQLLREVFLETDAQLTTDEGCTATVVMMQQGPERQLAVQAANVGDSSALVVNASTGTWCKLTADHRIANSSSERKRLQELGHTTVKKRLYGLNISRMLGDRFLKDEDLGFIAEPDVSHVEELQATHRGFIIIASDGLWDVISEERASNLVLKAFADDPGTTDAALIADIMLSQAVSLRSQDDITIMVVEKM